MDFDKLKHDFKGENRKQKLILEEILRRLEQSKELEDFLFKDMDESLNLLQKVWEKLKFELNKS